MSIVHDCMLVNLQVGVWVGHRLDKEASRKVTEEAGAESDAARVNKHIVPKEALKPIQTAASSLRSHFYTNTLPWKDNGDRLLTRRMFQKFVEQQGKLTQAFQNEVDHFIEVTYPKTIAQAEFRMGELFNSDDYPRPAELRKKFYVNLDIDAVTEAGDFRVALDQDQLDVVRSSMEEAMRERLGKAMRDVWARLADKLGHYAAKMATDEVFRDTTVRNLEELIDILPDLNLLNDPQLEKIRQDVKDKLIGYTPKVLREDKLVRDIAATEAQKIMDEMAGFMNAFGVAA